MYPCSECQYEGPDLLCPQCGASMMRDCPHCGDPLLLDLHEVWSSTEEFQFHTCCEALHEALLQDLSYAETLTDPLAQYRFLKPLTALFFRNGIPLRQVYPRTDRFGYGFDPGLEVRSITQKAAMQFVQDHHRHNDKLPGWKWGHGVYSGSLLVAVAIVGRPRARLLNRTRDRPHAPILLEVNRLCIRTDVDPHRTWCTASLLYGACFDHARQINHQLRQKRTPARDLIQRLITYTLQSESGDSLRASGWEPDTTSDGGSWNCATRSRTDKAPTEQKTRWTRWLLPRTQQEIFEPRTLHRKGTPSGRSSSGSHLLM